MMTRLVLDDVVSFCLSYFDTTSYLLGLGSGQYSA